MKVYKLNNLEEGTIVLLNEENFETVNLCDCYDSYGEEYGCYSAQCYMIDNNASGALSDLKIAINKHFDIDIEIEYNFGKFIVDYDTPNNVNDTVEFLNEILDFISEWREENEMHTEVVAYTYNDGSNWRSLILSGIDYPDLIELEDEESDEIVANYESCSFSSYDKGIAEGKTEYYSFKKSLFASDPFFARVEKL